MTRASISYTRIPPWTTKQNQKSNPISALVQLALPAKAETTGCELEVVARVAVVVIVGESVSAVVVGAEVSLSSVVAILDVTDVDCTGKSGLLVVEAEMVDVKVTVRALLC